MRYRESDQSTVPRKPGNADGGKGLKGRCIEEGRQCRAQNLKSIVNGTESAIREMSVSLPEERDAENLQVWFCEGPGPTDRRLK